MASASVAGKSKQSKSDPNRGDGPLATAPSDLNSSPAPLSRYESQKGRYWITFLQYLRNQKPPITLAGCRDNHVIEFLRYLDQFGKTKVHLPGCPFFGNPEPPGPCTCPLRQASGSLDALIERLRSAYEDHGGRPESNPFGAKAVRNYLSEFRECQARARGIPIPYKNNNLKLPTSVMRKTVVTSKGQGSNATGTGSDGDGSDSATQTKYTRSSGGKLIVMDFLEEFSQIFAPAVPEVGLPREEMINFSKDNEPVIDTFQKAFPKHHNPDTLKKLNHAGKAKRELEQHHAEKAKRELEQQEYSDTKLAEEHKEEIEVPPTGLFSENIIYNEPDIEIFQEAGGVKIEGKCPTTAIDSLTTSTITSVTCSDGDGSGSAAQTTSLTTTGIEELF